MHYGGFARPGCPLCRAGAEAEARYLDWFLLENYYSLPTLVQLERTRFCRWHAAEAFRQVDDGHLTGTFQALSQVELDTLRAFGDSLERERRARFGRARDRHQLPDSAQVAGEPEGCPVCEAGARAALVASYDLAQALETEDGRSAYREHDGLCRPHLWLVLRDAPREVATWLVADSMRRIDALLAEFERYFHRLDYRHQDEPKGEEQTAWQRALRFFWGDPPGFFSADDKFEARDDQERGRTDRVSPSRDGQEAGQCLRARS